jgi:hypothetical protein
MLETRRSREIVFFSPFVLALAACFVLWPVGSLIAAGTFLGVVGFFAFLLLGPEWVKAGTE